MPIRKFFQKLAHDWGKPVSKIEKYIEKLEGEMIDTVQDLELLISSPEKWSKFTDSWPIALPLKIEE